MVCERQAAHWRTEIALRGPYRIEAAIMETERCAMAIRSMKAERRD